MKKQSNSGDARVGDPHVSRRSGDDRRKENDTDYFEKGGIERRSGVERRQKKRGGTEVKERTSE
jgi:hypothetical protein